MNASISMFRPISRRLFDEPPPPPPVAANMAAEEAYHEECGLLVEACRKRLESFLASRPEIKTICSTLPVGCGMMLPLVAYQGGIFWDPHTQQLIAEDFAREAAEISAAEAE